MHLDTPPLMRALALTALLGATTFAAAPTYTDLDPPPSVGLLDVSPDETLPGMLCPREEVRVGTSFDATLAELRVREGQRVRRGEVLAVLDDRVARASVALARHEASRTAQIARAEAALVQAEDTLTRLRKASDSSAVAPNELIAAESAHRIARADLEHAREARAQAELQLALAESRLEEHILRAPFDAIAVRKHAEPGEVLASGDPIVELIAAAGLRVDLHLPASVAARLSPGERFALRVEDPAPAVVAGQVRFVEPRIDPIARTMRVVFDIEPGPGLVVGALVRPSDEFPPATVTLGAEPEPAVNPGG